MSDEIIINQDGQPENPNAYKTGFAVMSLVISLINFLLFGCLFSFVSAPISIILSVISLATHRGGKTMAVAGIIISVISVSLLTYINIAYKGVMDDWNLFLINAPEYVEDYNQTGEVPDEFSEYFAPEYDKYWSIMGMKDFSEFYMYLIKYMDSGDSYNDSNSSSRDRESLVDLSQRIWGWGTLPLAIQN